MKNNNSFELRDISKKYAPEERVSTYNKIKELRKSYFEEIEEIRQKIQELEESKEDFELSIKEIREQLSNYQENERNLKTSLFSKLISGQDKQEINNSQSQEEALKLLITKKEEIEAQISELKILNDNNDRIELANQELKDFYDEIGHSLSDYQKKEKEDQYYGSVENIINKYNVVFIHGIRPANSYISSNQIIQSETSRIDKIKTLISLEPVISTSTVNNSSKKENFWDSVGVVLNKGRVLSASSQGMGSKATGIKSKKYQNPKFGELKQEVENSLNPINNVNEFIIDNPSVCALYVIEHEGKLLLKSSLSTESFSEEDLLKIQSELNIPLYIFSNGNFHLAHYDENSKTYEKKEIVDNPSKTDFKIDESKIMQIKEDVLNNFPLKVEKIGDFANLNCAAWGKVMYLSFLKNDEKQKEGLLSTVIAPAMKYKIYQKNNQRHITYTKCLGNKQEQKWKTLQSEVINRIDLGVIGNWPLSKTAFDLESYVEGINQTIKQLEEKIRTNNFGFNENKEFILSVIEKIAFHLHGLASQAKELGDEKLAENASMIANQIVSTNHYDNLLAERLGPNGEMKIKEEEVKDYY